MDNKLLIVIPLMFGLLFSANASAQTPDMTKPMDIFSQLVQWIKNLFNNLTQSIPKNPSDQESPNKQQQNQIKQEPSNPSTTSTQTNVESSPDKPCVLDTSKPSLTGGTPTNPPCVIENGSTNLYCIKDNSGITCSANPPQQQTIQNTQTQQEQSPYGPKETQYYIDQLRKDPQFMDCSDDQLIQYLALQSHERAAFDKILKDHPTWAAPGLTAGKGWYDLNTNQFINSAQDPDIQAYDQAHAKFTKFHC